MAHTEWKRNDRKTVYKSPFVTVYEDTVTLPNGTVLDDYTIVQKPNIVIVVATDPEGNILTQNEYRYAVNLTMRNLPAGHIDDGEYPLTAAKRELLEETGYTSDDFTEVTTLYEYPTKDIHTISVIRAKNVTRTHETKLEDTEQIELQLRSPQQIRQEMVQGDWQTGSVISALTVSGVLF